MDNIGIERASIGPSRPVGAIAGLLTVVLVGAAIGLFVMNVSFYYVAAAIAGVILIGLAVWQFEAAVILYFLVAFVQLGGTPGLAKGGSGVGKGLYISELMLVFLLAVWVIRWLAGKRSHNSIRSGFHVPIYLYVAFSVFCMVHGFIFWDHQVDKSHQYVAVNVIELGLRMLSAGAFLLVLTTIDNRKWLGMATLAVLGVGVYSGVAGYIKDHPGLPDWWSLLTYLPACYFLAITLDSSRRRSHRLMAAAGLAVMFVGVVIMNVSWVSGWFGFLVALGMVAFIKSKRVFAVGLVAALLFSLAAKPILYKNVVAESEKQGDFSRFTLMAASWQYAMDFPFGVGPGNFRTYNSLYYGKELGTAYYTSAHGTYSQHLAEMGIPGTLLLISVLAAGFVWMRRSYRGMKAGASRTFLLASLGQLAGISAAAVMGDYIIPTYHNGGLANLSVTIYSWLIWGLAVAHVRISGAEANGPVDIDSQLERA